MVMSVLKPQPLKYLLIVDSLKEVIAVFAEKVSESSCEFRPSPTLASQMCVDGDARHDVNDDINE